LSTLISNVIEESRNKNKIMLSKDVEIAMDEWKDFLTEKVYIGSEPKKEEEKVRIILGFLFDYFFDNIEKMQDT